jgi:cell division protease FtsH
LAARNNQSKINQKDLEEALDRTVAGPERRSRIIDAKEKEVLAYHEAGHALVGELLEHSDPVHKLTILPRGQSLGSAMFLPEQDSYMQSENELLDRISTALAGRVAEEVIYGEIWTGASSDLQYVTRLARAMVCEFGMSSKLGTLALGHRNRNPFLGRDFTEDRNYSEDVARQIDEEVKNIVDRCHQRATELLQTHRDKLDMIVQALFEYETLTRDEFLMVLAGEKLPPKIQKTVPPVASNPEPIQKTSKQPSIAPPRLEPGPA